MKYDEYLWAKFIAVITVLALLSWASMGVWYATHQPPEAIKQSSTDLARENFVNACKSPKNITLWGNDGSGVPNTGSDDPTKWTCQR